MNYFSVFSVRKYFNLLESDSPIWSQPSRFSYLRVKFAILVAAIFCLPTGAVAPFGSGPGRFRYFIFFILLITIFSCSKKEDTSFPDMVLISEAEFIMGSNEGAEDERPERKVYVKSFFIDKYTVTNEQYKKFIDVTNRPQPKGWTFTGYDPERKDYPVTFVSYKDALAYCKWIGKRLPTEEEWEKSARGIDGRKYPWGNHFDKDKTNTSLAGKVGTVPVKSYENGKSTYGLFNMAGNVWEWTSTSGQNRGKKITKGGSWGLSHRFSRTFSRVEYATKATTNDIGFRCAKDK